MKFKVGDKVRVKKDLVGGCYYGEDKLYFNPEMEVLRGKVFNVEYCTDFRCMLKGAGCWDFNEAMLEAVDETVPEKLIIYRENNKTIAKYYKGDKTVTAEVKCVLEDKFDFEYGAKLAMDRAIEKMKEEEIEYSWVKCVGYRQSHEFYFTVGEKYKIFSNGRITDDSGYTYLSENTKEDMLDFLGDYYIFEEVN